MFRDKSPTVQDFAGRWAATMLWWATADETSLYRQESMHIYRELQLFISGAPMFQGGVRAPTGAILPQRQRHLPKWIRWASLLPEKQREIDQKLKDGWDVCYTDGSRTETAGVSHAGYGVWYSAGNPRNVRAAVPAHEKQTIGRAELRGVLAAVQGKTPGVKLHIVTDSEIVWAGLQGKCAKWERHAWVGSRGALAHRDLWMQLWQSWQLLGDSVSIQWVPSHAGVEGNEQADKCAVRGTAEGVGGGGFRAAIISPGKVSVGKIFATLANPKACTASRTHCTAKPLDFARGKFRHLRHVANENCPQSYPSPEKRPHRPPLVMESTDMAHNCRTVRQIL